MGTELAKTDDIPDFGPAMAVLTDKQRAFVQAYCEHPNYDNAPLVKEAGYGDSTLVSARVTGYRLMHNEKILAAINEEASKRLRGSGILGVSVMMQIAANPAHKDHLKAATALADRTGFHALSEHKVTIDDKRPKSRKEMVQQMIAMGREQGMSNDQIKVFGAGEIVDADFVEVSEVDADIEKQMEDL